MPKQTSAAPVAARSPEYLVVEKLLEPVFARWQRGIDDFVRQAKHPHHDHHKDKVIRSAIYADMEFTRDEMRLVESFYMQRMRHISQLGLVHLVYPDARHSRFEHMLGVLHSLKELLTAARTGKMPSVLSEVQKQELSTAALLHDIGHGPFSHTTETLLEIAGIDVILHRSEKKEVGGKVKHHERRCRDMLSDQDVQLGNLGRVAYGLNDFLVHWKLNPKNVTALITGAASHQNFNLLSAPFDSDKIDYFRRDAYFTGTRGGGVDSDALCRAVRLVGSGKDPAVGFDKRAIVHLMHAMFGRIQVYCVTAYHPVSRIAAALLLIAGDLARRSLPVDAGALVLANMELMNDRELLAILDASAIALPDKDGALLRRVVQRIESRRLPKRLKTLSPREFEDTFKAALPTLLGLVGKKKLPSLVYCRVSDIASGKYCSWLGDRTLPSDDLVILEMTPASGWSSADSAPSIDKELQDLSEVLLSDGSSDAPITLADWLELNTGKGSSRDVASALRAYSRATWRALVCVPATLKQNLEQKDGAVDQFLKEFAETLINTANCRPYAQSGNSIASIKMVSSLVDGWRARLKRQKAKAKAKVRRVQRKK